jgi:hypothetical protein
LGAAVLTGFGLLMPKTKAFTFSATESFTGISCFDYASAGKMSKCIGMDISYYIHAYESNSKEPYSFLQGLP